MAKELGDVIIQDSEGNELAEVPLSIEDVRAIDEILAKAMEGSGEEYQTLVEGVFYFRNMAGDI